MEKIQIALKSDEPPQEYTIERFEEFFGIRYFSHLLFSDWRAERWMRNKCARAYKKGRIGQLALWLGKLHGKQIEQGAIPDLSIRWVHEDIGYGAFTTRPFKKWEFIGEYTGILRQRSLFFSNINDYCFMYPRAWIALKAFTIDAAQHGTLTRFINHSDLPNCESVAVFHDGLFHIIFRATRELAAGEELKYDYGSVYWRHRKKLPEEPIESLIDPDDFKKLKEQS